MRQINELSNDELKNLTDIERINLCSHKIHECISYLKNYPKLDTTLTNSFTFKTPANNNILRNICDNILFQTQDKYISISIHVIYELNDSTNFYHLIYKQEIILHSNICIGLLNYVYFITQFPNNVKMYRKIYAYNLNAFHPIIIRDYLYNVIIDTIRYFAKKNDYFQGGYFIYLQNSVHNKLYKLCNLIDSNVKKTKSLNKEKHKSYLTDEEVELLRIELQDINIPKDIYKKYQLNNLSIRQRKYIKILLLIDVNKKISYNSVAKLLGVSERTIKNDFKKIYNHFKKFLNF